MATRRERRHLEYGGELGLAIGVLGLAAAAFAVGRATSQESQCCDRLLVRDTELLVCETRLVGAGLPAPG